MNESKNTGNAKRVARLKKILVITLVFLLIFPNITCIFMLVKQSSLEKQINYLAGEIADLKLSGDMKMGRLSDDGRLKSADALLRISLEDESVPGSAVADAGLGDNTSYAEENPLLSDEVVWTFSADGDSTGAAHKVYLTFDDGPSAYTDDILDILDKYGVKATFFVVGKDSESDIELYKRIVNEGHTLGMHSYSHVYSKIYQSEDSFTEDLDNITTLLTDATGETPLFYRFPGGSSNSVSKLDMHRFINILNDRGITYFDWNVSSGDASGELLSAYSILINSTRGIESRDVSVVLMHDSLDKPTTVEALPDIIEKILSIEGTEILPITSETEPVRHVE
ncbi:MAG: polysaccharide deacetylase [Lachnospiraceae bacterium]|nr:polysaccharide deacetylase [Lachnospiraceae bacterium]